MSNSTIPEELLHNINAKLPNTHRLCPVSQNKSTSADKMPFINLQSIYSLFKAIIQGE